MKKGRLIGRILWVALAFVMIGAIVGNASGTPAVTAGLIQEASADTGLATWSRISTPSEEGWVLAPDSTIVDYAVADDGEVAHAILVRNGDFHLLKSGNHVATWRDITSEIEKEIERNGFGPIQSFVKVATDPQDSDFVAVALWVDDELHVFISNNGGSSFRNTGEVEGNPYGLDEVLDFAVSPEVGGMRNLAIGGADAGEARLFRSLAIGDIGTGWVDATAYDGWDDGGGPTEFTSRAVVDIHFAPSWAADFTILVATATENAVHLQSGTWGEIEAWNYEAGFADAVPIVIEAVIPAFLGHWTAGINTPSDYTRHTTKRYAWVNVNYNAGDPPMAVGKIFQVINASVHPIAIQIAGTPWLTNVSYLGTIASGKAIASLLGTGTLELGGCFPDDLMAGCCEGVQVYRNDNIADMDICCLRWKPSCKPPTGSLGMEAFYVSPDKAYAVTLWGDSSYDEGAWSVSLADGEEWNQASLIDTHIDYLSDVAVSPHCNTMILASTNLGSGCGCDSVWLRADNLVVAPEYSGRWLRTWHGQLKGYNGSEFPERGLLRLAPEQADGSTVYLVDAMARSVYWNDVHTLGCWTQGTTTVDCIVDLAVKDEDTVYALDKSGNVTMSDYHGDTPTWYRPVESWLGAGYAISVSGNHVLVGGQHGDVAYSDDGGDTFSALGSVGASGYVTVAFDTYFDSNNMIFAAVAWADNDTDNGIYRWVIGESTSWTNLGAEPYDYTGLVLDSPDGNPMTSPGTGSVLYVSYVADIDGQIGTGVARCLAPAAELCCNDTDWDYLSQGLTSTELFIMIPRALKICGGLSPDSNSKLFAIDGSGPYDMDMGSAGSIWAFTDCYAKVAPNLISPAEGATIRADGRNRLNVPFNLNWNCECDLDVYDIEIARDESFTDVIVSVQRYEPKSKATARYPITRGTLSCGITYYWRVRAVDIGTGQAIHTWWSEPWSFAVILGKA